MPKKTKKREETVFNADTAMRTYADFADVILVALDKKGVIQFINKAGAQIVDWEYENLFGKNWFTMCLEKKDSFSLKSEFKKFVQGENSEFRQYENSVITKKGFLKRILWKNTLLRKKDGTIYGTLSSGQDITQFRKAQEELRHSLQYEQTISECSQTLLESSEEGLEPLYAAINQFRIAANADRAALFKNVSIPKKGLGMQLLHETNKQGVFPLRLPLNNTFLYKDIPDFKDKLSKGKLYVGLISEHPKKMIPSLQEQGLKSSIEIPLFVKKEWWGVLTLGETSHERVWHPQEVALFSTIAQMIESYLERQEHNEQMQLLSKGLNHTEEVVVITDVNGCIQYVNKGFEKLTQYTREEVLGKTPRILKSGKHDPSFYTFLWETILKGDTFRSVVMNKKKSGEIYYSDKIIVPIKNKEGKITHFVDTDRDITAKIKLQEGMEQSKQELQQKVQELERFTKISVGRELRMMELKKQIANLQNKLNQKEDVK